MHRPSVTLNTGKHVEHVMSVQLKLSVYTPPPRDVSMKNEPANGLVHTPDVAGRRELVSPWADRSHVLKEIIVRYNIQDGRYDHECH